MAQKYKLRNLDLSALLLKTVCGVKALEEREAERLMGERLES